MKVLEGKELEDALKQMQEWEAKKAKAIEDAFTSDGALYLRLVLTDQRSLNIRNLLCHGIVPPQYFESGAAARLLHVLIMLGMVKETS